MGFKDWLTKKEITNKEASIVFGNSPKQMNKKVDLGDDAFILGAPGCLHGKSKGPIKKNKKT